MEKKWNSEKTEPLIKISSISLLSHIFLIIIFFIRHSEENKITVINALCCWNLQRSTASIVFFLRFVVFDSGRKAKKKRITLSLDKVRAEIKALIKIICLFSAFLKHVECTYHFTRAHSNAIECGRPKNMHRIIYTTKFVLCLIKNCRRHRLRSNIVTISLENIVLLKNNKIISKIITLWLIMRMNVWHSLAVFPREIWKNCGPMNFKLFIFKLST